ncbi:MAG: 3-phosphoshikimate 1-carboxyvinyltransferase [Methanoregula sp. PtaU1.Bin051]|nr:MAG: 3-phosphoshikimate 1-carboxyvinyltransferase [Methanoregula sp. PtaU1.Bin051]
MNKIPKKHRNVRCRFAAPPSKSYTHRALVIAALASGTSIIRNPLISEDTLLTARALEALGVPVRTALDTVTVEGRDGLFSPGGNVTLDLNNSGTSLRLLASLALLSDSTVTLTGNARMQERPVGPLGDAITAAGGQVSYLKKAGYPPLRVGGRLRGGRVIIDGSASSQFISSLMIAAPYAEQGMEILLPADPASRSYLDITLQVMQDFGAEVRRDGYRVFRIGNRHRYAGRDYAVEGDYSSASYFFAIAAACGGTVTVSNLNPASVQGDRRFVTALAAMGCSVTYGSDSVTVSRTGPLNGLTIDMSSSPDTVQTLAIVAALANSPTTITGIGHLKFKESDRTSMTAALLRSLGGKVETNGSSMTIRPALLHGGTIDPAGDHRTAMSFAVLGLAIGRITITDAECVNKSFPGFWDALEGAGL